MTLLQIIVLACVQGLAELLPVSSSAHVIFAEKAMGLDPTSPDMTLLLVMLHTGTMFAVIVYFWRSWRETYFASGRALRENGRHIALATLATGVVGLALLQGIKYVLAAGAPSFEIEHLFGNTKLMAASLTAAGALIVLSSRRAATATGELDPRARSGSGPSKDCACRFAGCRVPAPPSPPPCSSASRAGAPRSSVSRWQSC